MGILHAPVIRRDSIPSLFQRFVLILRVYILENIIALIFNKMSFFLACVLILSYLDFINQTSCCLSCLIFVLPSKLHCDIIKATQFYIWNAKKQCIDRHSTQAKAPTPGVLTLDLGFAGRFYGSGFFY